MTKFLDFVQCENCGRSSEFRNSTCGQLNISQTWSVEDIQPITVACPVCKHVYNYDSSEEFMGEFRFR
jgi:endogenous inhibitor of DNA gyrase (YacG/DUF329 family)